MLTSTQAGIFEAFPVLAWHLHKHWQIRLALSFDAKDAAKTICNTQIQVYRRKHMKSFLKHALLTGMAITLLSAIGTGTSFAAKKQVSIGYQLMLNPWKVAIKNHTFEKATGYDINWVRFTAGGDAARGIAAGAVEIVVIGSVGVTTAVSNGVPANLFWIMEGIDKNERLVVREGIDSPEELKGKSIGVSIGSTSQLMLFYALKNWGIKSDVNVVFMTLPSIVAAWHRGDLDGAYIWPPALFKLLNSRGGHALTNSGVICEKLQICTYDGMMVDSEWAQAHPEFMWKFVTTLNDVNQAYVKNPEAWTVDSKMVQTISQVSGADAKMVPPALKNYTFPSTKEQASDAWLGSASIKSLAKTSDWLVKMGTLMSASQLSDYGNAVTTKWVDLALSKPDNFTADWIKRIKSKSDKTEQNGSKQ